MSELTYILGAGASYYSFPVVKSFTDRFSYFTEMFEKRTPIHNKQTRSDFTNFSNEIKSHQSFDTYFKKLFHLGNDLAILKAKKILNYYFLWEQLEFPKNSPYYLEYTDSMGNDIQYKEHENAFKKRAIVDNRYDALIAGLLKPIKGKTEFFSKINFITWNYDLNLLTSIKNFLNPDKTINEYILSHLDSENNNVWQLAKDLQVINMNGYFFSKWLDKVKMFDFDDVYKVRNELYEIKDTFSVDKDINEEDAKNIHFGWEDEGTKLNLISCAATAIKNSKSIIVIGYTFPSYNRLIDLGYFNSSSLSNTDVYIQDPKADDVVEFLKSDFGLHDAVKEKLQNPKQAPRIHSLINCDSFFIPNNICYKIFSPKNLIC